MTTRRHFLQGTAAGIGALSLPRFLAGCARTPEATVAAAAMPDNPFYAWFGIDDAQIQRVLSQLASRGGDLADVYFQHSRTNTIRMEDGIISSASTGIDQGVGLRVVIGDQTGYAFTEDLAESAILEAATTASAIASGAPVTGPTSTVLSEASGVYTLSVPWSEIGVDKKLPIIQKVEALAKAADPAVDKVAVYWTDQEERVLVAGLDGSVHVDVRPMARIWVQVTATKNGETLSNSDNIAGRRGFDWFTDDMLETVAKSAVDKTMILFEAKRPPAGEMPVVLSNGPSGILLHEAIGHGLEADFNRKNISIYAERMGERIAPDIVTIVDSGLEEYERGSLVFDDEGQACERTVLAENGILRTYLHDQISAKHYGVPSTGSGRRESFRHAPMPRMRCTFMENGPHTRDEIIASVEKGIIAETFTNGQVQIGAGDFTFYIKNGWLIENGRVTAPIKDVNIIGNGPAALEKVTMVANDARLDVGGWTCGKDGQRVPVSQGLPTTLVSAMTVGGEDA